MFKLYDDWKHDRVYHTDTLGYILLSADTQTR